MRITPTGISFSARQLRDYTFSAVSDEAYALPYQWVHSRIKHLSVTEREEKSHWHILLYPTPSGGLTLRLNNGQNESLDDFKIALGRPSVASSAN